MEPRAKPRIRRAAAILGLVAASMLPAAGAVGSVSTTAGGDLSSVRSEEGGVRYLGALVRLLVTVADTQSQAIRGTPTNHADLLAAVAAVDDSGLPRDPAPETGTLWAQIRPKILALPDTPATDSPTASYQAYSEATDLVLQQIAGVDDASGLLRDPAPDAFHLVDALTVRLPDMAVEAGRFDDLVTLADAKPGEAGAAAGIGVVRDRITLAARAFATELNQVFRATGSATLGPHLLGDVDLVNTDIDALSPTASVIDETLQIPAADPVSTARQAFDPAVTVLEKAGLSELDILLHARQSQFERRRADVLILTACGAAVLLPCLWWLLRDRDRERTARVRGRKLRDLAPRRTAWHGRGSERHAAAAPPSQTSADRSELNGHIADADPDLSAIGRPERRDP